MDIDAAQKEQTTEEQQMPQDIRRTKGKPADGYRITNSGLLFLVATCVIISAICGSTAAWFFTGHSGRHADKEPVTLDINRIITEQKNKFTEKYSKLPSVTSEIKEQMKSDIVKFTNKLNEVITEQSRDKTISDKDTIISPEVRDITDEIRKKLEE